MHRIAWHEVRHLFDPASNGALPDVSVPGASVADWQRVFDLVLSRGWSWEYQEDGVPRRLPTAASLFTRPQDSVHATFRVRPYPDVLVIFWPMSRDTVDADVDLRELRGQTELDRLCRFLAMVGRRLDKPVLLTAEGFTADTLLAYDPGTDRVTATAATADPARAAYPARAADAAEAAADDAPSD